MGPAWRRLEYQTGFTGLCGRAPLSEEVKVISSTNEKLPLKKGTGQQAWLTATQPRLSDAATSTYGG